MIAWNSVRAFRVRRRILWHLWMVSCPVAGSGAGQRHPLPRLGHVHATEHSETVRFAAALECKFEQIACTPGIATIKWPECIGQRRNRTTEPKRCCNAFSVEALLTSWAEQLPLISKHSYAAMSERPPHSSTRASSMESKAIKSPCCSTTDLFDASLSSFTETAAPAIGRIWMPLLVNFKVQC